jgi:hypothetical protein
LTNSNDNTSNNRKPKTKKEEVDLEITVLVDCKAERGTRMRNIVLEETRVEA